MEAILKGDYLNISPFRRGCVCNAVRYSVCSVIRGAQFHRGVLFHTCNSQNFAISLAYGYIGAKFEYNVTYACDVIVYSRCN